MPHDGAIIFPDIVGKLDVLATLSFVFGTRNKMA